MTRINLDRQFMEMAFAEAVSVKGKTLPNPPVGAVLVKDGRVIGRGGTRPAGQAHAEIVALEQARESAAGATLYVTLEPCCHHGKTAPCTLALIAAGVKRVVASCSDPNPKVSGMGLSELHRAGIEVGVGVLQEQVEVFYEGFFFFITQGRPKIVVKIAQSLDGRINARNGIQTPITGMESQKFGHGIRSKADAILIGGRTLRIDNPDLTPRMTGGSNPQVLILTHKKRFSSHFQVFDENRKPPALILSLPPKRLAYSMVRVFKEKGYHMVLLEGGRSVWTPFLNAGLCDTLYLFTSPKLFPKGDRWDENLKPGWVKSLEFHRFTPFGPDVLAEFRRV